MSGELEALAARVEAATGPDRELDAAVAAVARAGLPSGCNWAFKFPKWEGEQFGKVRIIGNVNGNGDYISGHFVSPLYTASLDAAMTLLPVGWYLELEQHSTCWTATIGSHLWFDDRRKVEDGTAVTPCLALTAASLRARAPLAREPGESTPTAQVAGEGVA